MPYNPDKDTKRYYSINEVAEMVGVSESLLRYWEKEFPTIHPKKSSRNIRQYTKEDIEEIKLVYNLVKVRGMKLQAARDAIRKNRSGMEGTSEVIDRLLAVRAEIMALKRELDELS